MKKYLLITTATNTEKEANFLARILLEDRLISCCQITKINSSYWWNGKVVNDNEYLLQMKTKKELYKEVEKLIKKNHSYELPEIVAYEIENGSDEFLNWISTETRNKTEKI